MNKIIKNHPIKLSFQIANQILKEIKVIFWFKRKKIRQYTVGVLIKEGKVLNKYSY